MEQSKELKHALENDYPLIPMSEITEEARVLAVAWMDCDDKRWIGNKQKLASDMMNYARRTSIAFSEWKEKLYWWTGTGYVLHKKPEREQQELSTTELFDLFI